MQVKHTWRKRKIFTGDSWDYDAALAELKIARRTLPNDFRIPEMTAHIQMRQGHLEESTRNLVHAIELNPHSMETRVEIAMLLYRPAALCRPKICPRQHFSRFSERLGYADMAGVRGISGKS